MEKKRSTKGRRPMVVDVRQGKRRPRLAKPTALQNVCRGTKRFLELFFPPRRNIRPMKLYLVRHGETVDNVAQAERLGRYLTASEQPITHVFSSDLQRAVKTAEALLSAQTNNDGSAPVTVRQLPILREQDFGFYEGKPFYARQRDSKKSGKDAHRSQHQDEPGFQDVESKESMSIRTNAFVAEYLSLLFGRLVSEQPPIVVIVSHGIILSHLWRSILAMFSKHTVTLAPGLSVGSGGVTPLEYLGGWSNTGYLELDISYPILASRAESAPNDVASPLTPEKAKEENLFMLPASSRLVIRTVNGKEHLRGLKRARG
ncbi:MAG: hypothetical protein Q9180_005767, partial [Flavoplaca navasiana]